MRLRWIAPAALASLVAGCGSIGAIGLPFGQSNEPVAQAPAPLPAAPTTAVESAALPPVPGQTPVEGSYAAGQAPTDLLASNDSSGEPVPADAMRAPGATPAVPAAQSVASGAEVGRTDLLGGWTIAAASDNCQLFMTLTSWTGGYRASTRGCSSTLLTSISAWSLNGNQVVLAGSDGATVARLYSSGTGRFDGQSESGAVPVSFYR